MTAITALIISLIALTFTARNFWRKSGLHIRGQFCISTSAYCKDKYVSHIVLENSKDRSAVIFKIYLLVGRNYYIELDDFEDSPLILKPFEAFARQYDPVDFYSASMREINLNDLLGSRKIKSKLVLSTSEGKYEIKEWVKRWYPFVDFFNNHMTELITPMRSTYKEKCYGSNVKFIVDLKTEDGKAETIPIYPRDYETTKFRKFSLTQTSLDSKENLEEFLYQQATDGNLNCINIVVHDVVAWRNEVYKDHRGQSEAKYYNWFSYVVMGRIFTIISDYKLKIKNRKNRKSSKAIN